MSEDIGELIRKWEFDPNQNIRSIVGDDGREKVQLRIDSGNFQGIFQMELNGRPDGKKPHGYNFALDFYKAVLANYITQHESDKNFYLDEEACQELFDENKRVHMRYVFLFNVGDYKRAIRDTTMKMGLYRFVEKYAGDIQNRIAFEEWWPYVIGVNGAAKSLLAFNNGKYNKALVTVQQTINKIEALSEGITHTDEFYSEIDRSKQILKEVEKHIKEKKPLTQLARELNRLDMAMKDAVGREDYENAAKIRDQIKYLTKNN